MARTRVILALSLLPALAATTACLEVPDDLETPAGQAAAPSSAQELLDRHIAASGGAEALRALTQRTVEARVVFKAQEGCEEGAQDCIWEDANGQFVLYSTADGRMYRRMLVGDNVLERGFDGETGWQMQSEPRLLVLEDPAATPVLREDALLHWYFDVDQRDALALELLPPRKIETPEGELTLDGIRWFAAGPASPESEKWFDRATGLLYEEIERDTETGDLVRRVQGDYREVDGVLVPFLIQQITSIDELPDQVVELRMQVVHHREIEDQLFVIPELEAVEPAADQLLANLETATADVAADPKDAQAHVRLARAAFQAAHFEEAKAAASAALELERDELEALYTLARVALLQGDLRTADKQLRAALSAGLRPDEAARQQAWIHLRQGNWNKAGQELSDAGFPVIGERYAAFEGKPLQGSMTGGCSTSLPLDSEHGDVLVVEVGAEGERMKLLVDTGASDVIISDARARSLVIGTDAMAPLAAGGPNLPQGQIETLKLGALEVKNVPVTMFPADQLGAVVGIEGVDGVLGMRPFAGRQLTVDREQGVLELVDTSRKCSSARDANRRGEAVPFFLHETHYLYVLASLNDAEGLYLLNTGMRGADLTANEGAYAHAGIGAPPVRAGMPSLAHVARFSLGGFSREDLGAAWGFLQQNATSDYFRLDGMLGLPVFGRGRWTLDFDNQTLYLNAPTKPAADPEAKQPEQPEQPKQPSAEAPAAPAAKNKK
ncbi:clan AA aspartic protease [Pseudenhygromyxa sp. WMMC2535]|uniref:retropepsin-like aspartic protease n=1 Tax=Pseudenhygromyxa sp. WMMC2535 TaxID=2712867 RepID=UPI0015557211|nr:retropepsin-like aspartic protease [Pseudenhygromyxa sp. WMMC2535]NVB38494.1 clan AA aspartic protease [Pseudenhygromyxa sp. WMMC2535]